MRVALLLLMGAREGGLLGWATGLRGDNGRDLLGDKLELLLGAVSFFFVVSGFFFVASVASFVAPVASVVASGALGGRASPS